MLARSGLGKLDRRFFLPFSRSLQSDHPLIHLCFALCSRLTGVKGDVPIHAISSAPGLLSSSDSNILNRIILQFFQRALSQ